MQSQSEEDSADQDSLPLRTRFTLSFRSIQVITRCLDLGVIGAQRRTRRKESNRTVSMPRSGARLEEEHQPSPDEKRASCAGLHGLQNIEMEDRAGGLVVFVATYKAAPAPGHAMLGLQGMPIVSLSNLADQCQTERDQRAAFSLGRRPARALLLLLAPPGACEQRLSRGGGGQGGMAADVGAEPVVADSKVPHICSGLNYSRHGMAVPRRTHSNMKQDSNAASHPQHLPSTTHQSRWRL